MNGIVQLVIGGVIASILIVSVAFPVIRDTAANITGRTVAANETWMPSSTERTLFNLLPTMVAIGALVTIVAFFVMRK